MYICIVKGKYYKVLNYNLYLERMKREGHKKGIFYIKDVLSNHSAEMIRFKYHSLNELGFKQLI